MMNKYGIIYMNEEGAEGAGAGGGQQSAEGAGTSLLGGAAGQDWMPEKYRVAKTDGSVDMEASSRKMAEAYKHLEQRMGSGDVPPKTHEEYAPKVEAEGFDWDAVKSDESMQGFLKGAHSKGLTNDQVSYVLGEYFKTAQQLVQGAQQLDDKAATEDLRKDWKTDTEFKQNLTLANKAFNAFASDADKARINEIGNNPIMLRILANIGKELQEDSPIGGEGTSSVDFDSRVAELRAEIEKMPQSDPRRKTLRAELDGMYQKKYGTKQQRLGGGTERPI